MQSLTARGPFDSLILLYEDLTLDSEDFCVIWIWMWVLVADFCPILIIMNIVCADVLYLYEGNRCTLSLTGVKILRSWRLRFFYFKITAGRMVFIFSCKNFMLLIFSLFEYKNDAFLW